MRLFRTDQIPATTGVDLVRQSILFATGKTIKSDELIPNHQCYSEPGIGFLKKVG